jgi:hypothetical protein
MYSFYTPSQLLTYSININITNTTTDNMRSNYLHNDCCRTAPTFLRIEAEREEKKLVRMLREQQRMRQE